MVEAWGSEVKLQGSGYRVRGLRSWLKAWSLGSSELGVQGLGFRVQGLGFRFKGLGVEGYGIMV